MARPKGSKNSPKPEQSEPLEQQPKQLSEPTKTLYLVNYWVPFPASEYGGLQAVLAADDAECFELIKKYSESLTRHQKDYEELIKARIKKATRYEIKGDNPSGIVRSFVT
jgi:hypothetical protein